MRNAAKKLKKLYNTLDTVAIQRLNCNVISRRQVHKWFIIIVVGKICVKRIIEYNYL